jgi:GT2 family glycosyltransferase
MAMRLNQLARERDVLTSDGHGRCESEAGSQMPNSPRVSIIIPTKNRPVDLKSAVRSIIAQTCAPFCLLIVDQSVNDDGRRGVENELALAEARGGCGWKLNYILDSTIAGASAARNHAMRIADRGIWLFLDDDVELEPDFIEQLVAVYRDYPEAGGVSGVITNYPRMPFVFRFWSRIFERGPFRDERQRIYWNADHLRNSPPIRVRHFTGALMSFRSRAVQSIFFDEALDHHFRGVSDGEDVAFCEKLGRKTELCITPRARLRHNHSAVGRLTDHWLRRHARANRFLYKNHWNKGLLNRLDYGWLWIGYRLIAAVASARRLSLEPWRALSVGLGEARQAISSAEASARRQGSDVERIKSDTLGK